MNKFAKTPLLVAVLASAILAGPARAVTDAGKTPKPTVSKKHHAHRHRTHARADRGTKTPAKPQPDQARD